MSTRSPLVATVSLLTAPLIAVNHAPDSISAVSNALFWSLHTAWKECISEVLVLSFHTGRPAHQVMQLAAANANISLEKWMDLLVHDEFSVSITEFSVTVIDASGSVDIWRKGGVNVRPDIPRSSVLPRLQATLISASVRAARRASLDPNTQPNSVSKSSPVFIASPERECPLSPSPQSHFSELHSDLTHISSVESSPASVLSHFRSNSDSSVTSAALSDSNLDTWTPPTVIYDREVIERWNHAVFGGPPEPRFYTGNLARWGDEKKTFSNKYLYQGGMSAVLTGGVMLGNPDKIYVPVRNLAPRHRSNVVNQTPF